MFRIFGIVINLAIGVVVSSLLFSCNLRNKVVLTGEGQGSLALSFSLPSYMLETVDTLAQSIPGGGDLLEAENMAKGLQQTPNLSAVSVKSAQKGAYDIQFRFQNFNRNVENLFTWTPQNDGSTLLSIVLSRESYAELEALIPSLEDNALLQLYGPSATEDLSRQDYLDMIEYSFGAQARSDLPAAEALISVQVPGKILSQSGGMQKGRSTVDFRLNLLDFALLKTERRYRIRYKPN